MNKSRMKADEHMLRLVERLDRYTDSQWHVIHRFLDKLAAITRKSGKISVPQIEKIITSFETFDTDVVIASLETYLAMDIVAAERGKGKNEKYVLGIMANKQTQKKAGNPDGRLGYADGTNNGKNKRHGEDEGARVERLAASANGGELECEF